tara:strand:- start:5795 stop:5959 length:165 start_codon:yes stop_codon:yes gene_type:complete
MRYGEQFKFGLKLNADYGKKCAEELQQKSTTIVKYTNNDLLEKIEYYKNKLLEL